MDIYGQLALTQQKNFTQIATLWKVHVANEHDIVSEIESDVLDENQPYFSNIACSKQVKTKGFLLIDYRFFCHRDAELQVGTEEGCVLMEFLLPTATDVNSLKQQGRDRQAIGTHNLYYMSNEIKSYHLHKGTCFNAFFVFMSKHFYFTLTGKTNSLHNHFAEKIQQDLPSALSSNYLSMNFEMENVIRNVRNCTRTGNLHRLCLEIKIQELLLLQFELCKSLLAINSKQGIHEKDVECIKKAAVFLEENYSNPPTIKNLAKMVGINEYKLKNGFKSVFKSTIHQYVVVLRMKKANELIKARYLQIGEIAQELGYKNPSHFSAAFKKYFGFLPTALRS